MNEDLELAHRMLAGNERAFAEFFESYFPPLYRFALSRLGHDEDAAEESVQAALTTAVAKLHTFRGEARLFTWLCTLCRHEIGAHYERNRRRPPTVELVEDRAEVRAALESLAMSKGDDPESSLRRDEAARRVHVALDRLPPRYGDALEWKYIDGLSVAEIAGRLAVSAKAAESILTRARNAFRDAFATLAAGGADAGSAVDVP